MRRSRGGYQPEGKSLNREDPPRGGSGVPTLEDANKLLCELARAIGRLVDRIEELEKRLAQKEE